VNEDRAREILKNYIEPDSGLYSLGHYMAWTPGDDIITLDCKFDVEELEAIAWWIRNTYNTEHDTRQQQNNEEGDR